MISEYVAGEPALRVGKRYGVSLDNVRYHAQKRGVWPGGRRVLPALTRFWAKVAKGPRCWFWTGVQFPNGYGCFSLNGESIGAHRYSFEQANGPIPFGLQLDHTCENKACVNPAHLEAVTPKENVRRYLVRKVEKSKRAV